MKLRKSVAWIGLILCALAALAILFTPAHNLFALIPAVLFVAFLVMLLAKPRAARTHTRRPINWHKVGVGLLIALLVLNVAAIVLVAIFAGWWFLAPLALLCVLVGILLVILRRANWLIIPAVILVITIILLGIYGMLNGWKINMDNVHIDNLHAGNVIVDGNVDVNGNVSVNGDLDVSGGATIGGDVTVGGNVGVEGDANIGGDANVNGDVNVGGNINTTEPTDPKPTEPKPTDPKPTEPKPTDPEPTEPKPTEPKPTEPPHEHKYTLQYTAATCCDKGYKVFTCSCGETYTEELEALGHNWSGWSTSKEPTVEAEGEETRTCTRCGATETRAVEKLPVPEVVPAIKCKGTIRYGETLYVNLEGIDANNIKVSNKLFVAVEIIDDNRIAITLTEDVTGYLTITDTVSGTNVVIDIVTD